MDATLASRTNTAGSARLARLRAIMAREELDAFVTEQAENRRYLSGFTGSSGILLISAERAVLATDFRYYEQVKRQAPSFTLAEVVGPAAPVVATVLADLRARRVGFEAHALTVETHEQWRAAVPNVEWVATSNVVEGLRQEKDADEVRAIEEAVRIADDAMAHLMSWIEPGMTERQVAWEAEVYMRTHGAEALAFTTIVAAGPHGAMSHAVVTDRPIRRGDPVVIDMGARVDGYCSDITRSFCLAEADERYLEVWRTVLEAQLAAERQIRAGMTGVQADAIARRHLTQADEIRRVGHLTRRRVVAIERVIGTQEGQLMLPNALAQEVLHVAIIRVGQHHLNQLTDDQILSQTPLGMVPHEPGDRLDRPSLGGWRADPAGTLLMRPPGWPRILWMKVIHGLSLNPQNQRARRAQRLVLASLAHTAHKATSSLSDT